MRGVAAIAVLFVHLKSITHPLAAPMGAFAVDLFFVLSGFIIAHAYEDRIRNGLDFIEFMKIRLIRLYPLYILGTLVGFLSTVGCMFLCELKPLPRDVIIFSSAAAFFVPLFRPDTIFGPYPFNPPAWSLIFELAVNAVYIIVLPFLTIRRMIVATILALLGLLWTGWLGGPLHGVISVFDIIGGTCRTIASFTMGLLIFRVGNRRAIKIPAVLLVIICACIFAVDTSGSHATALRFLAIFPLIPVLVWCGTANEPPIRLRKIFTFLGRTSYAIYAIHWPLFVLTMAVCGAFRIDLTAYSPWAGIVLVCVLIMVAAFLDDYYDMPVRKFLSRVLLNHRAPFEVPTSSTESLPNFKRL
jgi:peptidoglycan/LPS O-acetylase OafA/YrhL